MEIDESDIHAFLDGELDPEREALVLAQLDADPDLRARFADYAEHKLLLRAHAAPARPNPRTLELGERLRARLGEALGGAWTRPWSPPLLRRTAAVVLLLALGWQAPGLVNSIEAGVPAYVAEAAAEHRAAVVAAPRPSETWVEPGLGLDRMLSNALDEAAEVPELEALGFRLVGWRTKDGDEGRMASLAYEDARGVRVTVTLCARDMPRDERPHLADLGELRVAFWSDGAKTFTVIADREDVPLETIFEEIERSRRVQNTAGLVRL